VGLGRVGYLNLGLYLGRAGCWRVGDGGVQYGWAGGDEGNRVGGLEKARGGGGEDGGIMGSWELVWMA